MSESSSGQGLLKLINEYLSFYELPTPARSDLERVSRKIKEDESTVKRNLLNIERRAKMRTDMLLKFDQGKRDDFFTLWHQYLPSKVHETTSLEAQQVEFYMAIYFAIFPGLSTSNAAAQSRVTATGHELAAGPRHVKELSSCMTHFKRFLETRGSALAHTPAFLAYYALPYVPQPESHPSFEELYKKGWVEDQRSSLSLFLEGLATSDTLEATDTRPPPQLLEIYKAHVAKSMNEGTAPPLLPAPRSPVSPNSRSLTAVSKFQQHPRAKPTPTGSPVASRPVLPQPHTSPRPPSKQTSPEAKPAPKNAAPPLTLSRAPSQQALTPSLRPSLQRNSTNTITTTAAAASTSTSSPQPLLNSTLPPHALRPSQLGSLLKNAQNASSFNTSTSTAAAAAVRQNPDGTIVPPVRRALSYTRSSSSGGDVAVNGSVVRGPSPSLLRSLSNGSAGQARDPDVRFEVKVGNGSSHSASSSSAAGAATAEAPADAAAAGSRGSSAVESAASMDGSSCLAAVGSSRVVISGGSGSMVNGGVRRLGSGSGEGSRVSESNASLRLSGWNGGSVHGSGVVRASVGSSMVGSPARSKSQGHIVVNGADAAVSAPAKGQEAPRPSPPNRPSSGRTAAGGGATYRRHSSSSSPAQHDVTATSTNNLTSETSREQTPPELPLSPSFNSSTFNSSLHTITDTQGEAGSSAVYPLSATVLSEHGGIPDQESEQSGYRRESDLGSRQSNFSVKEHSRASSSADEGSRAPVRKATESTFQSRLDDPHSTVSKPHSGSSGNLPVGPFAGGDSLVLHGSHMGSGFESGDEVGPDSSCSGNEDEDEGSGEESDNQEGSEEEGSGVEGSEAEGSGSDDTGDEESVDGEGSEEAESGESSCPNSGATTTTTTTSHTASSGSPRQLAADTVAIPPLLLLHAPSISSSQELSRSTAHPLRSSSHGVQPPFAAAATAAASALPTQAASSNAGKVRLGTSLIGASALSNSIAGGCSAVPRAAAHGRRASGSSVLLDSRRVLPSKTANTQHHLLDASSAPMVTAVITHSNDTDDQATADPVSPTGSTGGAAAETEQGPSRLRSPADFSNFYPDVFVGDSPQQVGGSGPMRSLPHHRDEISSPFQLLLQESMALSQMGGVGGGGVVASSLAALEDTYCSGVLAPLEYHHIKEDITAPDVNLAARLFQSLRWRLTRCRPGPDRWHLLTTFTHEDLLGCHSTTTSPSILASLLALDPAQGIEFHATAAGPTANAVAAAKRPVSTSGTHTSAGDTPTPTAWGDADDSSGGSGGSAPNSHRHHNPRQKHFPGHHLGNANSGQQHLRSSVLLHELARLMNAIASDRLGRAYLLQPNSPAVEALIWILSASGSPTVGHLDEGSAPLLRMTEEETARSVMTLRTQAVVALQKLSLKRRGQGAMVRLQLLPWLVQWLQDLDALSDFSLEYSMALLMNLVLRSAGRAACVELDQQVLAVCEDLAEHTNDAIRTYVNGTLYSIFSLPPLREAARARGTDELLKAVAAGCSSSTFRSQIHHILDRLATHADADSRLDLPPTRELLSRAASLIARKATPTSGQRQLSGGGAAAVGGGVGKGGVAAWGAPPSVGAGDGAEAGDSSEDDAGEDGDLYYDDEDDGFADVEAAGETLVSNSGVPSGEVLLCSKDYLAGPESAQLQVEAVRSSMLASSAFNSSSLQRGHQSMQPPSVFGKVDQPATRQHALSILHDSPRSNTHTPGGRLPAATAAVMHSTSRLATSQVQATYGHQLAAPQSNKTTHQSSLLSTRSHPRDDPSVLWPVQQNLPAPQRSHPATRAPAPAPVPHPLLQQLQSAQPPNQYQPAQLQQQPRGTSAAQQHRSHPGLPAATVAAALRGGSVTVTGSLQGYGEPAEQQGRRGGRETPTTNEYLQGFAKQKEIPRTPAGSRAKR